MFQALAKRIRREKGEDSRVLLRERRNDEEAAVKAAEARTERIEKEKQIGVCKFFEILKPPVHIVLSQLSKKFPIADVLEKKNIDELDEELAYQI